MKVGGDKSDWIKIGREVRQGYVLSPDLFSLHSQVVIDAMVNMEGVAVGELNINNIWYADDTVLIANTEDTLQRLVDKLNVACNRVGLKINVGKIEVKDVTKRKEQMKVMVVIGNKKIKQNRSFRYLGNLVSEN